MEAAISSCVLRWAPCHVRARARGDGIDQGPGRSNQWVDGGAGSAWRGYRNPCRESVWHDVALLVWEIFVRAAGWDEFSLYYYSIHSPNSSTWILHFSPIILSSSAGIDNNTIFHSGSASPKRNRKALRAELTRSWSSLPHDQKKKNLASPR